MKLPSIVMIAVWALPLLVPPANAFYSPAQGRWLSRDRLGELGGINLAGMLRNAPLRLADGVGLSPFSDTKSCEAEYNAFLAKNTEWEVLVRKARSGAYGDKCMLPPPTFRCDCTKKKDDKGDDKGYTDRHDKPPNNGYRMYTIVICCNLHTTVRDLRETVAHELAHYVTLCADQFKNFDDCAKETPDRARHTCMCARMACMEMTAAWAAHQCDSHKSCWKWLSDPGKGYLNHTPCGHAAWATGMTEADILKMLISKGCNLPPGLPVPSYPDIKML